MTGYLLIAATLLNSILAGAGLDRIVVQMPAWRRVGARAWAVYSREADLGNGLFLYPMAAIGGAVLTAVAGVSFYYDGGVPIAAAIPVFTGALMAVIGLLATIKAAPRMLSIRIIDDDPGLRQAFEEFDRWGFIRAIAQMLAFVLNLWALVAVLNRTG